MSTELLISRAIINSYFEKLSSNLCVDVAFVGAGPSALTAARKLALSGHKVVLFEKNLTPGGGIWGGGMFFNEVVLDESSLPLINELGISSKKIPDAETHYTVDSVELASGLIFAASQAGVTIFNSITVEDIVFKENRVCGLVINWTAAKRLSMIVDPLAVMAEYVVDATGHPSEILHFAKENAQAKLKTTTGEIIGERPMWVDRAEQECVNSTDEYFSGLFACGMSAVNATGKHRMGAIFSGMFNSGHKLADTINEKLLSRKK